MRYVLRDNFLTFWFRFVYKYGHLLEVGNLKLLRELIQRDYATFSGLMLERYFTEVLKELQQYSYIGRYWDRKGEHEIDIVAVDTARKVVDLFEIKRNPASYQPALLQHKGTHLLTARPELQNYTMHTHLLSLLDL